MAGVEEPVSGTLNSGDAELEAIRLRRLLDSIQDHGIYMLSTDGVVATCNSGAASITGYQPSEIVGRSFLWLFPEDELPKVPGYLDEAAAIGRCDCEGWQLRRNGSRFWASSFIYPMRAPNGGLTGYTCITRDITERMAAQDALVESERRFRLLVEGIVDYAIYMIDPCGIVTNWNAGAERLKGYTADEIVGHHFSRFYTREDRAGGGAGAGARDGGAGGALRIRRMAHPQGRQPLLGVRCSRCHSQYKGRIDRLRQDYPRHH